jgi:hypothetical protein
MRSIRALAALALTLALTGCGQATGESADSFPAPPDGMRWVGYGRVVVAVPDWWTTGETTCDTPVEDTVYFDHSAVADCADTRATRAVREVSALALLDATGGYGEKEARSMRPLREVDGRKVVEREGCEGWFEGVCRRMFAVPSAGVVFAVTIAEPGDGNYEDIRDSLRVLPEGLTTIPLAIEPGWTPTWGAEPQAVKSLIEVLQKTGLRVDVKTVERSDPDADYADLPVGSLLEVSPQLGSVIEDGGTVTVTLAG